MDSDIIGLRVSRDGLFVLMGDGRALPLPNFFSVGFARHPTEPPAEATPGSGPAPTLQSGTVFSTTPTSRLSVEGKASLLAALVDELKTLLQEVEALRAFKASVPWAAWQDALRVMRLATVSSGTGFGPLEKLENWIELHKPRG